MSRRLILSQPFRKMKAGDVAYWDGSNVKTIDVDNWNTSLGTPIGVVVIPEGLLPDGIGRIISLTPANDGNSIGWSSVKTDNSQLTNYAYVPNMDSNQIVTGHFNEACLPSDAKTEMQSIADPLAYYNTSTYELFRLAPSPYLGDALNPDYYMDITGNNALSDFNGKSNTEILLSSGTDYTAANAAYNYSDGISSVQWYLPSAGEIGFLCARYKTINDTLSVLNGNFGRTMWSSTENTSTRTWMFSGTTDFGIANRDKSTRVFVQPFAMLYPSNSSGLITFTIDDVEYQAEQGMTWTVWCESTYNTGGYFYGAGEGSDVIYTSGFARYINLNWANPSTTEIEETSYNTAARNWPL